MLRAVGDKTIERACLGNALRANFTLVL